MSFTYNYPRPCVTTDCLIFKKIECVWHLLLIERGKEPFKGCWALPGGFLEMEEDLDTCAARHPTKSRWRRRCSQGAMVCPQPSARFGLRPCTNHRESLIKYRSESGIIVKIALS